MLCIVVVIDSFNHSKIDIPKRTDIIIMLGGGDNGRMEKAAELYHASYADYVMITPKLRIIMLRVKSLRWSLVFPIMISS